MIRRYADVVVFVAAALGLAWLFALPLWLGAVSMGGAGATLIGLAMMVTPALAVLIVWRSMYRKTGFRQWASHTGLGFGTGRRRTLGLTAASWFGMPVLVALAIAASAAVGVLAVDLDGLSLFRAQLEAAGAGQLPAGTLATVQVVSAVLVAPAINALPALGEEWGWRGWLLPRLLRFGTWPALLLSGLIWGVWHAPLTLLGYNYPLLGGWAMPMFVGSCVLLGIVLGWLRLYSGSVWPPVLAHASLNATAGLVFLIGDADDPPVTALAGATGLVGWALLAVLGAVLLWLWPIRPDTPNGIRDGKTPEEAAHDTSGSAP